MAIGMKARVSSTSDAVKGTRFAPASPPLTAPAATAQKVFYAVVVTTAPLINDWPETNFSLSPSRRAKLTQDSTNKLMGIGEQARDIINLLKLFRVQ